VSLIVTAHVPGVLVGLIVAVEPFTLTVALVQPVPLYEPLPPEMATVWAGAPVLLNVSEVGLSVIVGNCPIVTVIGVPAAFCNESTTPIAQVPGENLLAVSVTTLPAIVAAPDGHAGEPPLKLYPVELPPETVTVFVAVESAGLENVMLVGVRMIGP
jgi:hypothetical protein